MLADLLDLVLPGRCAGCGGARPLVGRTACARCWSLVADRPPALVAPRPRPPGLPPVTAAGPYDGVLRATLLAHKERGGLALARPLGALLAGAVAALPGGAAGAPVALVPVPSSRAAVRARGHDHALRLARAAAVRCGLEVAPVLVVAGQVRDSAGLDAAARAANLAGALAVAEVPPGPVVVVDDVLTTGATLCEAARALRSAGADVRGAAVVAATRRRGPRRSPPEDRDPGSTVPHTTCTASGGVPDARTGGHRTRRRATTSVPTP